MIDNSNVQVICHVWIRDPDTDVTILKQRDITPRRTVLVHEEIAPENCGDTKPGSDYDE